MTSKNLLEPLQREYEYPLRYPPTYYYLSHKSCLEFFYCSFGVIIEKTHLQY